MHHGTLHVRCRTFKRHVNLIEHRATSLVNVCVYFWCCCFHVYNFIIESLDTTTIDRGSLQKKKKKTIQKKEGKNSKVSTKECATNRKSSATSSQPRPTFVQPSSNINTYLLLVNVGWCIFVQQLKQTICSRVVYI